MDPISETVELRKYITDFLKRELVGPDPGFPDVQQNGEEILRPQDPPRLRYSAGVLFPLQASVDLREDADEKEVEEVSPVDFDEEEANGSGSTEDYGRPGAGARRGEETLEADQEVNLANEYLPSAMGMSALVDVSDLLRVEVSAARYVKRELPDREWTNREGKSIPYEPHWRIPIQAEVTLKSSELVGEGVRSVRKQVAVDGEDTDLQLHVLSRPRGPERQRLVTFTLMNRRMARSHRPQDDECFFQCEFTVYDPSGNACFAEYPERPGPPTDQEEASLRLLYRHRKVYAVGHGCAPDWEEPEDSRSTKIWSESLPMYEVKPILPRSIEGLDLPMLTLSREDDDTVLELCGRLAEEYLAWIEQQERRIEDEVPDALKETARKHMELCRECLGRMQSGIRLIRKDEVVRRAFALMNRAMLMQQIHYGISSRQIREWVSRDGEPPELERPFKQPDYDDPKRRWRPFQLAFVLMSLRSIVEPQCAEREIVDLIWFPTGGGKTEAYLGLSAFTILLRRLRDPGNAGTTVLMRYTLRLLTTQQFQRAASLICALEYLRREQEPSLGSVPVTIGLWVGGEVTPNREATGRNNAVDALNDLQSGAKRDNPFIVLSCPWCGAQMGPVKRRNHIVCKGYKKLSRPSRVRFGCEDSSCAFSGKDSLPLHVIDEAMYDEPPTLVIGTVDKFAMLPWRPEARSLFGLESDGRYAPPELVIQDELHLISGPLGSMVGHYETVVDLLCEKEHDGRSIPAKIVASTATISRAPEQIHSLYGREKEKAFLFPPQGLTAGDSFFAEESEDSPGRLYTGVFASALPSHVTAQVNVLSALLQGIKSAPVANPEVRDPYWTLVVYFNSLRELGHAATLIQADIRERLNAMWDRLGLTRNLGGEEAAAKRRFINHALELTSRIQSGQIPETLQELFTGYTGDGSRPVDVCLATNMIQVGLDVPRLSLMALVGQPKMTSEYIQATSRVGRRWPGLVTTIYNPAKPRDRSHFEHFRAYHEAMYRHVEPTSVTPFAVPVRERALHALVVTLVRFWGNQAEREHPSDPLPRDELLQKVRDVILKRVEKVDSDELDRTREEIDDFIEDWKRSPHNRYGDFAPPREEVPLMYPAGNQPLPIWLDRAIPTPSSMRNVDATCNAQMIATYPQAEE